MTKYLAMECTKKLNFFPSKHGISKHYNPQMILHQKNLDYAKHCKYTFGFNVQGHNEPAPSNTIVELIYTDYHLKHPEGSTGKRRIFPQGVISTGVAVGVLAIVTVVKWLSH
jgi:hypothetical protein